MERTSTASINPVRGLLAAVAVVSLIRAMTLPVTLGEAWNYVRFIEPPWREALEHFDSNNHIINTILVRISTSRFHLTELSLRLPSLLGGLLYWWAVYRLATRRFGAGFVPVLVAGLLTLNPMVLDAMGEARGYGMGLGFLMWALELILESAESFNQQKFKLAAVCLGLSVAAALAFAAPAAAMAIVILAWGHGWLWPKGQGTVFVLLVVLTTFIFVAIPLDHIDSRSLVGGATSLRQSLNEISAISLGTSLKILSAAARIGAGLLALAGAVAALRVWRQSEGGIVVLTGGTLAVTLVILLAAHRWTHSPFPEAGAVYLIPLCTLTFTSILLKWNHKTAQVVFQVASIVLICRYVSEADFKSYASGHEYSGGRTLAKKLRAEIGLGGVSIGVSESAEPVFNYYRLRLRQGNWDRAETKPLSGTHEYYVLAGEDRALVNTRHLQVLYQDANLTLAR